MLIDDDASLFSFYQNKFQVTISIKRDFALHFIFGSEHVVKNLCRMPAGSFNGIIHRPVTLPYLISEGTRWKEKINHRT
jgi:hypothetical protein